MVSDGAGNADFILIDPAKKSRVVCDATRSNCPGVPSTAEADAAGRGGRGGGRGGRGGGGGRGGAAGNAVTSPDGTSAAFIRDWNLWVRDVATGQERQLTTDGVKDFGYATDNAGWASSDRAILLWSPDSKKIATQQQDERKVGDMYLVETKVGHPTLKAWKYPLPGDSVVAMLQRVIIDVGRGQGHRGSRCRPSTTARRLGDNITMDDYNWSPDGSQAGARVDRRAITRARFSASPTRRPARCARCSRKRSQTHFESRTGWRVLWPTNEVIWYSQRDDWGQLYLYDLNTGALKDKITTGEGPVTQIARIDEKTRTIWYAANGREKGQDPYFAHFYRIGLDGEHAGLAHARRRRPRRCSSSPDGKYLVDTYSKPDVPPVVTLRDARRQARDAAREGRHLAARRHRLEAADSDQGEGRRRHRPISTA